MKKPTVFYIVRKIYASVHFGNAIEQGFPNIFLNKAPFKEIKKLWTAPTGLLKKLFLKTPKNFFAHHRLKNTLVFSSFFQVFQISSRFLKVLIFGSILV